VRDAVLSAVHEQPEIFMDNVAKAVNALTVGVDGAGQMFPTSSGESWPRWGTRAG